MIIMTIVHEEYDETSFKLGDIHFQRPGAMLERNRDFYEIIVAGSLP